jgi:hypothetical protein
MIRVALPFHLRTLARVDGDIQVSVEGPVSVASILDAVEKAYPMLKGTIRDHDTHARRPFLRFFACGGDLSLADPSLPVPAAIAAGSEVFLIVGAVAGG